MTPLNSWELYEARLNVAGKYGRDRAIQREREALLRKYMNSPALKDVEIDDVPQQLFIHSTDTPSEKTFNTLPGETVDIGDIIYWNEMHWLVTKVDFDDEITRGGRIVQCNRQIRWQNQHTGEIIERWCLLTKPYTSNIAEGVVIATSNREFKVQIPYDDETIQIDLDRRFLLEVINGQPKAYEVTSVDAQTNRYQDIEGGFLIWNLSQCDYNPATDNAELMIADYFEPKIEPVPDAPLLPCRINGRETIRGGMRRKYSAVFYDALGEITQLPQPVWSVSADVDAVAWTVAEGVLELYIPEDTLVPGSVITLTVADADGAYAPAEMNVEVVELL